MNETTDFRKDLPVADVRIGKAQHMRVYAFNAEDMGIPLVEVRFTYWDNIHLTVDQAEAIAAGLLKAAAKARGTHDDSEMKR